MIDDDPFAIPPLFRKKGIERVETNLPDGAHIQVPPGAIAALFGAQLLEMATAHARQQDALTARPVEPPAEEDPT